MWPKRWPKSAEVGALFAVAPIFRQILLQLLVETVFDFLINRLISDTICILIGLIACTAILHVMFVWPFNCSKVFWKKVDYFWFGISILGLLSLVTEVRVAQASAWYEIEKTRLIAEYSHLEYFSQSPGNSHYCWPFVKSGLSPSDFDEREQQRRLTCTWMKKVNDVVGTIQVENEPLLFFEQFPTPQFTDSYYLVYVTRLKQLIGNYNHQVLVVQELRNLMDKSSIEQIQTVLWPFLLLIALAIRLTKVSGELRHEILGDDCKVWSKEVISELFKRIKS